MREAGWCPRSATSQYLRRSLTVSKMASGSGHAARLCGERALTQLQPGMLFNESGPLEAFDLHRERIYATETKAYERGRKGSYDVLPEDL